MAGEEAARMIPAKNRERKCSTCKHYQPSPLWRKGWCRNPLLYDRNTNHLVEADSLACNRTFIDYWEPISGPGQQPGPQPRTAANKPRIAPSIPLNTFDQQGNRNEISGNTPADGVAALSKEDRGRRYSTGSRQTPQLAIVTSDYDDEELEPVEELSKVTRQIERVPGPGPGIDEEDEVAPTAAQRIRQARRQRSFLSLTGARLYMALGLVVVLLAAAAGGAYLLSQRGAGTGTNDNGGKATGTQITLPGVQGTITNTIALPTPTGFGDATATPVTPPTQPVPPDGVIGVNGWVKATTAANVRQDPSLSGAKLFVLQAGKIAHVVDGPKDADGYTWWNIDQFDPNDPAATGWIAENIIEAVAPPQ